jgi:hypothetical protein
MYVIQRRVQIFTPGLYSNSHNTQAAGVNLVVVVVVVVAAAVVVVVAAAAAVHNVPT